MFLSLTRQERERVQFVSLIMFPRWWRSRSISLLYSLFSLLSGHSNSAWFVLCPSWDPMGGASYQLPVTHSLLSLFLSHMPTTGYQVANEQSVSWERALKGSTIIIIRLALMRRSWTKNQEVELKRIEKQTKTKIEFRTIRIDCKQKRENIFIRETMNEHEPLN